MKCQHCNGQVSSPPGRRLSDDQKMENHRPTCPGLPAPRKKTAGDVIADVLEGKL